MNNQSKSESGSETKMNVKNEKWEYRIIHLNVNQEEAIVQNPEEASTKLKGSLSPEFLSKEFPKQYGETKKEEPKHPANQLQEILNLFGEEHWELFEISNVGRFQMLFFKRKKI